MNEFKYQFVNIILLALLGFGIYWAFSTIDNGIVYDKDAVVAGNTEVTTEDPEEVVLFDNTKPAEGTETAEEPVEEPTSNNAEIIAQLEALIDAKVIFKKGSNGEGVKTVQAFLDEYFTEKDITIDGDFGPGTEKLVKEFQTKELNGGDGRFGPNTGKKMVEVLKG